MDNYQSEAAAPLLRASQIDGGGTGNIRNSVNLFRGDVGLPCELVSLPGRNGMEISLTAYYNSNVHQNVNTCNKDAPTGDLGEGWTMPFDKIVVDGQQTASNYDDAFYLVSGNSAERLIRTGSENGAMVFELQNYQFWKILYFPNSTSPSEEKWIIAKEDGSRHTFGAGMIQWGVRWGNWIGSSGEGAGKQYPIAWNLKEIRNIWGDCVFFEYENDDLPIGSNPNACFTRDSRLSRVTSPTGNTITLQYQPKDPCELQLPAVPRYIGEPNAIQYQYPTSYLDRITVQNSRDEILKTVVMEYSMLNVAPYPQSNDDFYKKRYLTSIKAYNQNGALIPGPRFEYWTSRTDVHPGALKSVEYAEGAIATYYYESKPLLNSSTRKAVSAPESGAVPRVWHGPDYSVITWYSSESRQLHVSVYTWGGTWNEWTSRPLTRNIDYSTFTVQPASGFFAVSYKNPSSGEYEAFILRQNPYKYGVWDNLYEISLAGAGNPLLGCGSDFVALCGPTGGNIRIIYWQETSRTWQETSLSAPARTHTALIAGPNYCLAAFYTASDKRLQFQLYFCDALNKWRVGDSKVKNIEIDWEYTSVNGFFTRSASLAAASYVNRLEGETATYGLTLLGWNEEFVFQACPDYTYSQKTNIDNPVGLVAGTESLVACSQHLFRFTGKDWKTADLPQPLADKKYRYSYGSDTAIQVVQEGTTTSYSAKQFIPSTLSWENLSFPAGGASDGASINGQYCIIGRKVYCRDSQLHWNEAGSLPYEADPQSIYNSAPSYILYSDKAGDNSYASFVKGDRLLSSPAELPGEKFRVDDPVAGQLLAGPTSFVTYRGESFDKSSNLYLYQVINESLEKNQKSRSVCQLTIDDGYGSVSSYYEYDLGTATYDPYGRVAQYVTVKSRLGSSGNENGYTKNIYFNGLNPDVPGVVYPYSDAFTNVRDFFSLFSGQLFKAFVYDCNERICASSTSYYYAYDCDNGGPDITGTYCRLRRKVDTANLEVLATDPGSYDEDAHKELPAAVVKACKEKGLVIEALTADKPGRKWSFDDADSGRRCTVVLASDYYTVYAELDTVTEWEFNQKGQEARHITYNYDSSGQKERKIQATRYIWEVYPETGALNILTPSVEKTKLNETRDKITEKTVTTYLKTWPGGVNGWSAHKEYAWNGASGTEIFDFQAWSGPGEPPAGWIKTSETTDITPWGQTIQQFDISGIYHSVLYDTQGVLEVAKFDNAGIMRDEASYYGFEAYENSQGWTITSGEAAWVDTGDSYCGERRLVLPGLAAEKGGLAKSFAPGNPGQKFLLCCYTKTGSGYDADPGKAAWEIILEKAGKSHIINIPIPDTSQSWRYFHYVIDPAQEGMASPDSISLLAYNQKNGCPLLLDAVAFLPLQGSMSASVYEPLIKAPTAKLGMRGETQRLAYDFRNRLAVETGNDQVPDKLTAKYQWKEHSESPFDPDYPNSELEIAPRQSGYFENFHHGDEWRSQWTATEGWSIPPGTNALVYAGGREGSLTANEPAGFAHFGVRIRLQAQETIDRPLGISIGSCSTIRWQNGWWELVETRTGQVVASYRQPAMTTSDLLLIVTGQGVQFLADSRLILSHVFDQAQSGQLQIFTGNCITLSYIISFTEPLTSITYSDNTDRAVQSQSLSGCDIMVAGQLYDSMGREAIQTKTASCANTLFGYRPGFVRSVDWTTGRMTGEVADFYPGDAGYPYSRLRYDSAPTSLVIESGAPGALLAINLETPEVSRHTVRLKKGTNNNIPGLSDLPNAEYIIEITSDQDHAASWAMKDMEGKLVAAWQANTGSTPIMTRYYYDAAGNAERICLPNYFSSQETEREKFQTITEYDFFGRKVSVSTPDSALPVRVIYDTAGRSRFMVNAQGIEEGYILYCLYDSCGRVLEEGSCDSAWDQSLLQAHADDPAWLPAPGLWNRQFAYDGDGSDPSLWGRLSSARSRTDYADKAAIIEESYQYDIDGRVTLKMQNTIAVNESTSGTVRQSFDNLGNIAGIECRRESSPAFSVVYSYNDRGLVDMVSGPDSTGQEYVYAAYDYDPQGRITRQTFNPGRDDTIVQDLEYNSAGLPVSISCPHFAEKIDYYSGGYGGAGYYSGRIARTAFQVNGSPDLSADLSSYDYKYAYDRIGRLQTAQNSVNASWSLGVGQPLDYDGNGNTTRVLQGQTSQTYTYEPGTNRLQRVSGQGQAPYGYDANGNLTSAEPRAISRITYDRLSGLTGSIMHSSGGLKAYHYNASGYRVMSNGNNEQTTYIRDEKGNVICMAARQGGAAPAESYYVTGPLGTVAVVRDSRVYNLLKDHQNSTRVVVCEGQINSVYHYLPFGDFMGQSYEPSGRITPFLFTGQELDGELGLYNFNARMYDPSLGRFYSSDPAMQFPSPYLYSGGDWVNFIDPTGMISWGAIGAIIGGIIAAVIGITILVLTGGLASAPLLILAGIGGGLLLGAGMSSLIYGATHTKDFSWKEWAIKTGFGALTGAIGGGTAAAAVAMQLTRLGIVVVTSGVGILRGGAEGLLTNGFINMVNHQSFTEGWAKAVFIGFAVGFICGFLGGAFRALRITRFGNQFSRGGAAPAGYGSTSINSGSASSGAGASGPSFNASGGQSLAERSGTGESSFANRFNSSATGSLTIKDHGPSPALPPGAMPALKPEGQAG